MGTLTNRIDILRGVNLTVKEGESIAIVGTSGSGKTTLLSLLAGLDLPTQGEIILDGQILSKMNEDQRARCRLGRIGFVFQNFELLPHLTALENVMLPLELGGQAHVRHQASEFLENVGLKERLHHFPRQLSGGEQQRVAIARAYVTHPKVLFADEPTGCLDIKTGEKVIDLLFHLNNQMHTTLVFVTHDQNLAQRCERSLMLEEGQLV